MYDKNFDKINYFTVQNAEETIVTFLWIVLGLIIIVYVVAFYLSKSIINSFLLLINNTTKIMSGATLLLLLREGVATMFLRRARRERQKLKEEKKKRDQEIAQIRAEAQAEYAKRINEWDERRKTAEAQGKEFTEPLPPPE